jgi:hypothetical protein
MPATSGVRRAGQEDDRKCRGDRGVPRKPERRHGDTVHFPAVPTMQATVATGRPVAHHGYNQRGRLRRIRKLKRVHFC